MDGICYRNISLLTGYSFSVALLEVFLFCCPSSLWLLSLDRQELVIFHLPLQDEACKKDVLGQIDVHLALIPPLPSPMPFMSSWTPVHVPAYSPLFQPKGATVMLLVCAGELFHGCGQPCCPSLRVCQGLFLADGLEMHVAFKIWEDQIFLNGMMFLILCFP